MSLKGRHILLGVTGSIAAYKAAMLIRALVKEGAEVRVVMTPAARDFITPLTLATLCRHPVLVDNFDPTNGAWNSHISLGEWADHYLIAPATANTLAKMAAGIADGLLLCSYLSARCPVSVAPAMDLDMYRHPATQANLALLRARDGVGIVEPGDGELASGLVGKGRMAEPEEIIGYLRAVFFRKRCFVAGEENIGHRRGDGRTDRSGSVRQQLFHREDGIRHRRGAGCAGGRGDLGERTGDRDFVAGVSEYRRSHRFVRCGDV